MSLARNVVTVGSATLVSRALGYARDAGIAALLGTTFFAEAFFALLQVVNFFRRMLAEGALNSAFVPIWLDLRKRKNGIAAANRFTLWSLLAMLAVTAALALLAVVLGWFVMGAVAPGFDEDRRALASYLLLLASPYIVLSGLVAVIAAALNADGRVLAVGLSAVLFNVVMLVAVAFAYGTDVFLFEITLWLTAAIVVAGLVQLVCAAAVWLIVAKPWVIRGAHASGRMAPFMRRSLPGLIAAGMPQLKLVAVTAIVSGSPAAVSWLYYANRLYELPLGVAAVVTAAVILPRVSASLQGRGRRRFIAAQSRAYELVLGLALPAAAGFALLAAPITATLFEHGMFNKNDTAAVAAVLVAICAGLPGHVLEKVFGTVSFAHHDTHTPMLAAFCGLAVAVAGGLLMFARYGYVGAAAAFALSGWIGAATLGIVLYRRSWLGADRGAARRLPRIVLATAVMSAAVLLAARIVLTADASQTPGLPMVLLGLIMLGVAVYVATLRLLGVARLTDLVGALKASQ